MSARAWERRRANKRDRILHRKINRAFGISPSWRGGPGSYSLGLSLQAVWDDVLQEAAEEAYRRTMGLVLYGSTFFVPEP